MFSQHHWIKKKTTTPGVGTIWGNVWVSSVCLYMCLYVEINAKMLLISGFGKEQNPGINMWYADRQTDRTQPRCGGVISPIISPPARDVFCMASLIGYCLARSSCSHDPDWWIRGRNGCLHVVSVTHTTPPGERLRLVVMIHHLWLSGTLRSEDHDIIPG